MTISFVRLTSASSDGSSTTLTSTFAANGAGNFACIGVYYVDTTGSISVSSVTDDNGNTWNARTEVRNATQQFSEQLWYCYNLAADAGTVTITATFSAATTFRRIHGAEYTSSNGAFTTDPYEASDGSGTGNGTALATGTLTPALNNEIICCAGSNPGGTISAGTSFTLRSPSGGGASTGFADHIQTTATAETAKLTSSGSGQWGITAAKFKDVATAITPAAESSAATVTANNATVALVVNAESAAVAIAANDATVDTGNDLVVNAEAATLTVAANDAASSIQPAAEAAAVTLAANDASAAADINAGVATLTVTANNAGTSAGAIPPDGVEGVEWAFQVAHGGAQITDDDLNAAEWEEITCLVRDPFTLTVGRQRPGEKAPARELRFIIDNTDSRFSPENPESDLYPYVDLGLVFRYWRRDSVGDFQLRATVALDDLDLTWPDGLEEQCLAVVVASGPGRWLDQGIQVPVTSSTSSATSQASALAVWPCTDGPSATTAANSLTGGAAAERTTADVRFGQITGPVGTLKYPDLSTSGRIHGQVATTAVVDKWTVSELVTAVSVTTGVTCLYWQTTSPTAPAWRIHYETGGPLTLRWIAPDGTETAVCTYSTTMFDGPDAFANWHRVGATAEQVGGDVQVALYVDDVSVDTASQPSITTGRLTDLWGGDWEGPGRGLVAVGQLEAYADLVTPSMPAVDYDGEQAHVRWLRLVGELDVRGVCDGTESIEMGAQTEQTIIDALDECEDSEQGLQVDTADGSLQLITTREMYNRTPAIVLDVAEEHLGPPFAAARSDSTAANDVTITRKGGSSRRRVVAARRNYSTSDTLSLLTDDLAMAAASWRAHYGALTGARITALTWDCVSSPELLDATLALLCGDWFQAVNLPAQYPGGETTLILQGWAEEHSAEVFRFTAFGAPTDLYRVGTIAADVDPEDDPAAMRIDSDTSTVDVSIDADDVSIVVASDYGWSTATTPYDWMIGAEQITVDSIGAYGAGVQAASVTRAVNGVSQSHDAGDAISLWEPYRIGY